MVCKINWDYQVDTEHLCFSHWRTLSSSDYVQRLDGNKTLSSEAKRRLPTCDCGLGRTFPSTWRLSFLFNMRRKACGSWALHGKLVYSFGAWKNEVMCWNCSHTWKTSGGKAEAREHREHAQHCLSLRTGVWIWSWSDRFLANCMLYLWMRGQWLILFYLE